ncbi:MAG: hypothetical protein WA364_16465 [Candidatus Nitrosopolaris sp.]
MTTEEAFKVTKDDTFGHRYFCKQCLEQMKLSQGAVWDLVTSEPKKQGAPRIGH